MAVKKSISVEELEIDRDDHRGKKPNQKLKPYLVLQILMEHTDEDHVLCADEIVDYLGDLGIFAERRSIYSDIAEINKALYAMEAGCTIEAAGKDLEKPEYAEEKVIAYKDLSRRERGFYVRRRKYELMDLRLLAECVYSSRFLSKSQSDQLIYNVICEYASEHQRDKITYEAFQTDRVKTSNKAVLDNIEKLKNAMRNKTVDDPHIPEKVKLVYVKRVMKPTGIRTSEKTITVSPYRLMINDGYYYLLAYNGRRLGTWRVDRMKDVIPTGEPRDCDEEFAALDLSNYAQCNFGMMINTKRMRVKLICGKNLLDTLVDRFGTKGVIYNWVDEDHFSCEPIVELNHQFYGWVCGLGEDIKIDTPEIAERYANYLSRVRSLY